MILSTDRGVKVIEKKKADIADASHHARKRDRPGHRQKTAETLRARAGFRVWQLQDRTSAAKRNLRESRSRVRARQADAPYVVKKLRLAASAIPNSQTNDRCRYRGQHFPSPRDSLSN